MQIHQILVRPDQNRVTIVYMDLVGRRNSLAFDSTDNDTVQALIADCKSRVPADSQHPEKAEIEQEITDLATRIDQLKAAIGET